MPKLIILQFHKHILTKELILLNINFNNQH